MDFSLSLQSSSHAHSSYQRTTSSSIRHKASLLESFRLRRFGQGLRNKGFCINGIGWWKKMQAGAAFAQAHSQRQVVEEGEHYRILGLKQDASDKDIKAAFRQLARQYHPDVNKEDGAGDSFKSIRLAYEVLSNSANRTAYDESLRKKVRSVSKHRSREKSEYRNSYSGASRYEDKVRYRTPGYRPMGWGGRVYRESQFYHNGGKIAFYQQSDAQADREFKKTTFFEAHSSQSQDWLLEWGKLCHEVMPWLWVLAFAWHALGVQSALTVIVVAMGFKRELSAAYKVAYGVSWLMGGENGLIIACTLSATSRLFGNIHDTAAAISVLALWLGGTLRRFVPLPSGAILLMVVKCIQLETYLA